MEEIVENHISFDLLGVIEKRKRIYAKNTQQIEISAERAKNDKAIKIHTEIMDVAMNISEQSFEVKNKSLIQNEQLKRSYKYEWKNIGKELVLWKGVWRNKELFDIENGNIPNTVSDTAIGGISKSLLESRTEEDYEFFDASTSDKHIGENRINLIDNDCFAYESKIKSNSNVQTSRSGDKNIPEIKIFTKELSDREIDILSPNYMNYILDINKKTKSVKQFMCNIVKPLYIRSGTAVVTGSELYFFDDLKSLSSTNKQLDETYKWKKHIEFIHYRKKKDALLFEKWGLGEINTVHYRGFLSKNSSAEIFFNNNQSLLLYFYNIEDRDSFCKQLYKNRDKKETSKNFLVTNGKKTFKEKKITEKWMNWEISTFEYLMKVNIYANRGYNDISHYPVFPWLHVNDKHSKSIIECRRDLTKNMGQLGSKDRIEELNRKYEEGDCFENDSYHYGSHYSHPGIVLHYMVRLHPFTEGCLALQDGQYDVADRLFFSIPHAIENALNDISDVREVIPEFYFCPEIFMHMNGIKLGKMQSGVEVKDVILPEWAKNDPHFYVHELKKLLESEHVSFSINKWIDYIYG